PDAVSTGKRALKNLALSYIGELDDAAAHALAQNQYDNADNMTERFAALAVLANGSAPGQSAALARFYEVFEPEPLVIDNCFSLIAMARTTDVAAVRKLMRYPSSSL